MTEIDNGSRMHLVIDGVFDGMAGVQGRFLSFAPNRFGKRADQAFGGILNGLPVRLAPKKDPAGPLWTSTWEALA